jgi:hypothetical protein
MKKTLFKSLLLGFAALTALSASAENKLIMDNFEIAPGEMKPVTLKIAHDKVFSSIQIFFKPVEGLNVFMSSAPKDRNNDPTYPVDMVGQKLQVSPQENLDGDLYKIVLTVGGTKGNDEYNGKYLVANWKPATEESPSLLCDIYFKATDDFKGGQIVCQYCKGDYSDPEAPADWINSFEINDQVVCNVTAPGAEVGTPLKEIVETGVDGTEYTVKEDLAIVAKSDVGYLFVSDGAGNWMKVKADETVYTTMKNYTSIKGGTLIGVLSDANCNQTLTITKAAEQGGTVTASAVAWNLAQGGTPETNPQYKFAPKVNEVILLTGYWFANENAFRGYSNQSGQSATANFGWCDTEPTMQNGVLYKDIQSVAQLKEPWDAATTGAPAKVGANDDLSFQNYVVYPLAITESQVITGVDNLNAGKDVVSVQYVNAAGMVSTTPFKGVNMVVTRYADGSQVTTKVVK